MYVAFWTTRGPMSAYAPTSKSARQSTATSVPSRAKPTRTVTRHIIPHVLAPVIVQMTFTIPGAILAEAALSFIGIGIRPPTASWGNMIQDGFGALFTQPGLALAPAALIAIVTLAFTFFGDGLRDALDPRMRI